MNGVALKRVTEVQDLGVTLDSALQWNIHVKNIISKANRVSGLIKRTPWVACSPAYKIYSIQ